MAPNFSSFPLITQAGPGKFLMPSFLTAPRTPPSPVLNGDLEPQSHRVRTQTVNIHSLLFYCILLCAPEQREQIRAITIKSGHTPRRSNTSMMRILMRHLSKTPHHPHSSATTCHPKWGISCLQKAHCTVFTASLGPTFDFTVRTGFKQQLSGKSRPGLLAASPRVARLCLGSFGKQRLAGQREMCARRRQSVQFRFSQRGIPFLEGALD